MLTQEDKFAQNKRSMDQRDQLDRAFSPEYAATKQVVRTAREQIKTKNRQIKELRAGAGPTGPQHNRRDAGNVPHQTEDRIKALKHERNLIRREAFEQVQAQTAGAPPARQQQMQDAAFRELQKGTARRPANRSEPIKMGADGKGLDKMQDSFYQDALNQRRTRTLNVEQPAPTQPRSPQADNRGLSISLRFTTGLGYTKSAAQEQPAPAKTDPLKEAGEKEAGKKELSSPSLSVRFSSSLNLDKAKNEAANPTADKTPASPNKDQGKEDF